MADRGNKELNKNNSKISNNPFIINDMKNRKKKIRK